MATRIRLQRGGKKNKPVYRVVVTDTKAPRDGRYIEKLGIFDPNVEPNVIDINVDSALKWVLTGAQPSETARKLLSLSGVMLKKHLQVGVNKGAITQEEADKKFEAWVSDKDSKTTALKDAKAKAAEDKAKKEADDRLKIKADLEAAAQKAEQEAIEAAAAAKAEAEAAAAAEEAAANAPEEAAEEATTEEAPATEEATEEAPAAEEASEESAEEEK